MRFNTFKRIKTVQFEFFVFLLFFRILQHVKNRHFTWACFSAPNPVWRVLHRKPYEVSMPGLLGLVIFLGQIIFGKFCFSYFFRRFPDRVAVLPVSQNNPNRVPNHPPRGILRRPRFLREVFFFPSDPVWSLYYL